MSVIDCVLAPAFTSLCKSLKYSPKVRYIILIVDFRNGLSGQFGNTALCLENKITRHLVAHIFIKFSQNVSLINIYILIYRHARYDCILWNALWFYNIFGHFFMHYYWTFMSEWLYLHQTFTDYISNQYTHIYIRHARCHSKLWNTFWFYSVFLWILYTIDEYSCVTYGISTKLLRIVCLINTFILIWWYARCNWKLRKVPWFNCVLWNFQCLLR